MVSLALFSRMILFKNFANMITLADRLGCASALLYLLVALPHARLLATIFRISFSPTSLNYTPKRVCSPFEPVAVSQSYSGIPLPSQKLGRLVLFKR
jgi:hypothetical protein